MRCSRCGAAAPVLKTCRWRGGAGPSFALCDPCYAALAESVWIVPGPVICFGNCRICGSWFALRDLAGVAPGGRQAAPSGLCQNCAKDSEGAS